MIIMKHNHLSLLFTSLVLVLVFFGNLVYEIRETPSLQESINSTSFSYSSPKISRVLPPAFIQTTVQEQLTPPPIINAEAVLAQELLSQKVFFEQGIAKRWAMASLTKLMTAVIAWEKIGPEKNITFSEAAVATEGIGGGWQVGDQSPARELIRSMMTVSSNDAAEALAEFYGRENFILEMNQKAVELGMKQTHFQDPTGLSLLNQSTLENLRSLASYIYLDHRPILEMSRDKEITILGRTLTNINLFAGRQEWLGGKTGFTDESGGNLISVFDYNGQPLVIIVFGSENRFQETEKVYNWITLSN